MLMSCSSKFIFLHSSNTVLCRCLFISCTNTHTHTPLWKYLTAGLGTTRCRACKGRLRISVWAHRHVPHLLVTIETLVFFDGGGGVFPSQVFLSAPKWKKWLFVPFVQCLFSWAERSVSGSTDCHYINQEGPESSLLNMHSNVSWLVRVTQPTCSRTHNEGIKG